jgi:hypothetical protein
MFTVYGGKCLSRKKFTTGSRNSLKDVQKSHGEMEVQKWLRQQSKNFCAVGFEALVK